VGQAQRASRASVKEGCGRGRLCHGAAVPPTPGDPRSVLRVAGEVEGAGVGLRVEEGQVLRG